jgi:hypothetical protein
LVVISTAQPVMYLYKDLGSLIGSEWFAIPQTVNTQLNLWEVIWLP